MPLPSFLYEKRTVDGVAILEKKCIHTYYQVGTYLAS